MYGEIKRDSRREDSLKKAALRLIQLIALDSRFDPTEQGNVNFEEIHKLASETIDVAMDEILNPKLVLPSKSDILETVRKMDL